MGLEFFVVGGGGFDYDAGSAAFDVGAADFHLYALGDFDDKTVGLDLGNGAMNAAGGDHFVT